MVRNRYLLKVIIMVMAMMAAMTGCHSHSLEARISKPATCTQSGIFEIRCTECEYREECDALDGEELPSLGHDWINKGILMESSCYVNGIQIFECSRCGEKEECEIDAGHTLEGRLCVVCGYIAPLPEITVGMTMFRVKELWGEPIDSTHMVSVGGVVDTWSYRDNGNLIRIYFLDEKVSTVYYE